MKEDFKNKKFKRIHFVVNKHFQLKYVTLLLVVTGILCFGFAFTSEYLMNLNSISLPSNEVVATAEVEKLISQEKVVLIGNLMKAFFIVALIMVVLGIYITHKMAGPLFALQRRMHEVVKGDFKATLFKVRKGDEFQELIEAYNEMIFAFENRFLSYENQIKNFVEILSKTLESIENVPGNHEIKLLLSKTLKNYQLYLPQQKETFKRAA